MSYNNGTLICDVGTGGQGIFLIDEGKRRHIEDMVTFQGLFLDHVKPGGVIDIDNVPLGNEIKHGSVLICGGNDEGIFLYDYYNGSWKRRHIASMDVFNSYCFDIKKVETIRAEILDGLQKGPEIL